MASESTQKKISRVRKPRVHITYDVETGGAIEMKELPFVVGVLAASNAGVNLRVANKLSGEEGAQLNVALKFKHLSDFEPEQVVRQVEPLRKLLEARQRLTELKSKLDGNDRLEELLGKVLDNKGGELDQLKGAIGGTPDETPEESK